MAGLRQIYESDYAAIEGAIRDSDRGRWFLAEHARRNRASDTIALLAAIARLEDTVREQRRALDMERLATSLAATAGDVAQIRGDAAASGDTAEIRLAVTDIAQAASGLRRALGPDALLDRLDTRLADLLAACDAKSGSGAAPRIIDALITLERKLTDMLDLCGVREQALPHNGVSVRELEPTRQSTEQNLTAERLKALDARATVALFS